MTVAYRQVLRDSWSRRRGFLAARAGLAWRPPVVGPGAADSTKPRSLGPSRRLRRALLARVLRELESDQAPELSDPKALRRQVGRVVDEALAEPEAPPLEKGERLRMSKEIVADICGLGPIDPLFSDSTVSDVLVNGPDDVWVDRFGRLERTEVRFDDRQHLLRLMERLVASHGRHLDEASPYVDVRLADGSRLHALIPPLAPEPVLSIRRMRAAPFRIEELYACGSLTPEMGHFLQAAVAGRLNIVISGGAASGKTTLLNLLSGYIPSQERVVTIEETAELRLDHPHVLSLESRLPNIEGRGEVSLRALVKNALRMRPDRIIVGEVRGSEVFDMLQAMNTGHDGSLTTVHANSPGDAVRRLESLVVMGGFEIPILAIRELLASAIDLIVHTDRFPDGSRSITSIGEVASSARGLALRELLRYEHPPPGATEGGGHRWSGVSSRFLRRLVDAGLPADGPYVGDPTAETD